MSSTIRSCSLSGRITAVPTMHHSTNATTQGSVGDASGCRRRSRTSITQPSTARTVNRCRNGTRWSSGRNSCGLARMKMIRAPMPGIANKRFEPYHRGQKRYASHSVMRERVAAWLHKAGALRAVMELRRFTPAPILTILTYHHVADTDPRSPFDRNIADATPVQFRRQMEALARYGTPIGIDELLRALDGAPLPKNPVMVTFDDGYRSCHDVALPILRAVGVQATFFVSTSFISERRIYWWERIALLLSRTRRATASLRYPVPLTLELGDPTVGDKLNSLIKDTRGLDVERFLGELADALGVEWTPALETRYADDLIMTWD